MFAVNDNPLSFGIGNNQPTHRVLDDIGKGFGVRVLSNVAQVAINQGSRAGAQQRQCQWVGAHRLLGCQQRGLMS